MPKKKNKTNKIVVLAAEEVDGVRSAGGMLINRLEIDSDFLGSNINIFLEQMSNVMANAPDSVGPFKLAEVEVSAQITGKGQIVLWGIGAEVTGGGGLKFIFRK